MQNVVIDVPISGKHATKMEKKIKAVQQKFDSKRTISFASSFSPLSKTISLPGLSRPQSKTSTRLRKNPRGRVTINNSPNECRLDAGARNQNFPCSGGHGCEHSSHTAEVTENTDTENCAKHSGATGDVEKIYWQLNDVFAQRLEDIAKSGDDNKELKLATYQDWTDVLLKINDSLVANKKQLEFDLAEPLKQLRQFNAQRRQVLNESLTKSRRDLHSLVKIIQNLFQKGEWDFKVFHAASFETISLDQILGIDDPTNDKVKGRRRKIKRDLQMIQDRQLLRNKEALTTELAEKDAEIEVLRREIACVEDQIDYSWAKLQIINETIEQLQKTRKSDVLKVSKSE
uniref:Uncharacterized protein n=1 Tax=Glossina pallidipes TaxID=7398 RepID=A0A1B0AHT8_GLOPL